MAVVAVALFVLVVLALARWSARTGHTSTGCCAPADPADDLRMRDGAESGPRTQQSPTRA